MNQLSMVCRSDPILLITKSQNNKDQKVVGHAVCSSFVVPWNRSYFASAASELFAMCQCLVHCAPLVLVLTQKIRRLQPCPSKAVMWTPAFCLIYILRHSPSIPPLPAAPCQHHHPTTPTGFIQNAEFKLISDIWPFVKLFSYSGSASVQHGLIAHRELERQCKRFKYYIAVKKQKTISTSLYMMMTQLMHMITWDSSNWPGVIKA